MRKIETLGEHGLRMNILELPAIFHPTVISIRGLQILIGTICELQSSIMVVLSQPKLSYSPGPEILKYFQDVAKDYDLRKYIKFRHLVSLAVWDEEGGRWNLKIKNLNSGEEMDD